MCWRSRFINKAPDSSDMSFNLDLLGMPVIIHNVSPEIAITAPTNNQFFLAPSSILISANASDSDGSVTKVEFFADGVKIGEATNGSPYQFTWNNPPIRAHVLTAVATDNQNATTLSAPISIVVYDAIGTPVAAITSPADGAVMEGPTNLLITATANAINGVTNVQFLANGIPFGNDATRAYSAIWTSQFLSNGLAGRGVRCEWRDGCFAARERLHHDSADECHCADRSRRNCRRPLRPSRT